MGLFGLFASLVGLGYAQHKSVQNIRNMQNNYRIEYGECISDQEKARIYNEKQEEVMDFFNSRVTFYYQNPDKITNVIPEAYYPKEAQKVKGINGDYIKRIAASVCAYKDLNNKYCPNYESYTKVCGGFANLTNIIRGLSRKEIYRRGGIFKGLYNRNTYFSEKDYWTYPLWDVCTGLNKLPNFTETYADPKWHVNDGTLKLGLDIKFCDWWSDYTKPDCYISYFGAKLEDYKKLKDEGKII